MPGSGNGRDGWPGAFADMGCFVGTLLCMSAHRMRAFLLAKATAAFCQPLRCLKAITHWEIGSRLCLPVSAAALAPCTSKVRRQLSPCLVMAPGLAPLKFCRGANPSRAANCAPFLNCLKSPTVATVADAVSCPKPLMAAQLAAPVHLLYSEW